MGKKKNTKSRMCLSCGKCPAEPADECPYSVAAGFPNGDGKYKICTCCEDCRYDCAMASA
jgi:hypothetical protein